MAMGAVAGIGIALSTAGTVAGLAQQQQQASQQRELSLQQALDAEQRIELAMQRYEAIRQSASLMKQRELEVVTAQRRAAELDIQQQIMNNKVAQLESRMGATQLRNQGEAAKINAQGQGQQVKMGAESEAFAMEQAAQNQLAGRQNEQINQSNALADIGLQNVNELNQVAPLQAQAKQVDTKLSAQGKQNTNAGMALEQQAQMEANQALNTVQQNNQQRRSMGEFNRGMAARNTDMANRQLGLVRRYGLSYQQLAAQESNFLTQLGVNQDYLAGLGAQSVEAQQQYADLSMQAGASTQRQINKLQTGRNRAAINAGYQSTLATQNMSALSSVLQEKAQIAQALANASQVQSPGALSYASAIAGGLGSAYNAGLIKFGGGGSQPINYYPPISQYPPENYGAGQPINYYPGIRFAQQSTQFGQPLVRTPAPGVSFGQPLR